MDMERPEGFSGNINHYEARELAGSIHELLSHYITLRGPELSGAVGRQALQLTVQTEDIQRNDHSTKTNDGYVVHVPIEVAAVWRIRERVRRVYGHTPEGSAVNVTIPEHDDRHVTFDVFDHQS